MKYKPYTYQQFSFKHLVDHPYSGLFLDMGLGKTVIALTATDYFMYQDLSVSKTLVIAPKRVAETVWTDEIGHWDHLNHLRPSVVLGTPKERVAALNRAADVYIINRENVVWLVNHYRSKWPFDFVIIDELSSFKSSKSARFRALRTVRPKIKRLTGLTGTPAPNSLIDLWSQLYLIDQGERLEKTFGQYKQLYFSIAKMNNHIVYKYGLNKGAEGQIHAKIQDICVSMRLKDYHELPDIIENKIMIKLSERVQKQYDDFEADEFLELIAGQEITAVNAAALTNKLLQFSNGAVYDESKKYYVVHDEKLDALEEVVEGLQGRPALIAYAYQHDAERILKRFKQAVHFTSSKQVEKWNNGEIELLVLHPASAGHGLNLQRGGNNVIWFGSTWSSELYQQLNSRLHRQGQRFVVVVHKLICRNTMDEDVVRAVDRKISGQNALLEAIKARIKKYKKT